MAKDKITDTTSAGDVPKELSAARLAAFRKQVWKYWKQNGRHDLPWRLPSLKLRGGKKDFDPYRILVSEIMLQQTQVPRVIEKYKEFLKAFPNVRSLARSSLTQVLKVWSGMGYNRRGKYLRDAAVVIVEEHGGKVPKDFAALQSLPGVGPYTASAVRVFAFNLPDILIETNVRAAFIHRFFANISGFTKSRYSRESVSDGDILPFVQKVAEGQDPRTWQSALFDYGAYIKKNHQNPSRKSKHYVRQSKFEGSLRQVRGAILRELHKGASTKAQILTRSNLVTVKFDLALMGLERDGLIKKVRPRRIGLGPKKGKWRIA